MRKRESNLSHYEECIDSERTADQCIVDCNKRLGVEGEFLHVDRSYNPDAPFDPDRIDSFSGLEERLFE